MAQTVKRLPAMQETRAQPLGEEDPLEKVMAIHSSTLAWKIPWMEEPGGLQSMGSQRSDTTEQLHFPFCSVMSKSLWSMDCCPPGSSVSGIFKAKILE